VTRELFLGPAQPTAAEVLAAVTPQHFGAALQSADLSCVWGFRTLLGRDFGSAAEYQACVASLPSLVLGARGARCELASRVLSSAEFKNSSCAADQACVGRRLGQFLCLGLPGCAGAGAAPEPLCDAADRLGLFVSTTTTTSRPGFLTVAANEQGNAALMDPAWKIGD